MRRRKGYRHGGIPKTLREVIGKDRMGGYDKEIG
jgi:hypothetical protein